MDNYRLGIFYGLGAYLLWGVLPIYWKLLQHVEAMEILANRFLWSAVFVFLLLLAKYSLQGTTQSRYLTGGVPPVRFSM